MTVKDGDRVLLPEYGAVDIKHENEELQMIEESSILAILK